MTTELDAVKRGYAYVDMNERGHFFSEGNYDILGPPLTDGDDAITWMTTQPWSNGKVGTIGCSSTAEWQMARRGAGRARRIAAMIPQGFGAGVGRVAPYYEQGNWYRGGAVQMLFIAWLYGEQNQVRPMFPPNTSQEDLIRASRNRSTSRRRCRRSIGQRRCAHLPEMDIIKAVDGPKGIFADEMPSRHRRRDDQARAERPRVVQGRPLARRHEDQRSGLLVHVVVRRLGGAESRRSTITCARPRAPRSPISNTPSSPRRCIAATSARPKTPSSASAHGRRAAGLRRADLRLVRPFPQGPRGQRHHSKCAQGPLLHDGLEQVAVVGHVAARRAPSR